MNAENLKRFARVILALEGQLDVQKALTRLRDGVGQLAGNPNDTAVQSSVAESLKALATAVDGFVRALTPAQLKTLSDIGGQGLFTLDLTTEIQASISNNPMTPSVAHNFLTQAVDLRKTFLTELQKLVDVLSFFRIEPPELIPGDAQVGLTIPRALFDNRIDGMTSEIHRLDLMFRFFAEATTGSSERATVGEISSTDPLFFFGLPPEIVVQIAKAFGWAVETLAKVAELKKTYDSLRGQGLKKAQLKGIDDAINERVEELMSAKVTELMALRARDEARADRELEKGLRWSLETIMASVERGVTVEVRFLPPPGNLADLPAEGQTAFEQLGQAAQTLSFPAPSPEPILKLPAPEPPAIEPLELEAVEAEPAAKVEEAPETN